MTVSKAIVYNFAHFVRLASRMAAKRNDLCKNRLTEVWKVGD